MNVRAGVVTSEVVWLSGLPLFAHASTLLESAKGALVGSAVVVFASMLPDLDHPSSTLGQYMPRWFRRLMGGHRMGMHSIPMMVFAWFATAWLLDNYIVANAVLVGMAMHVRLDMKTKQGVALFYPFSRKKTRGGRITTGSEMEDRFVRRVKITGACFIPLLYGYLLYPTVAVFVLGGT